MSSRSWLDRVPGRLLGPALLVLVAAATSAPAEIFCSGTTPGGVEVSVRIDAPAVGDVVEGLAPCEDRVLVEGAAGIQGRRPPFDLILILDASGSTVLASGADIDADGELGTNGPAGSTDPGDSVLAAEVLSARRLLGELDGLDVRVAVIDFSAVLPDPSLGEQGRLRIVQSLTADLDLARAALDEVFAAGSAGATDYEGALDLARAEWLGNGRPDRTGLALFLTDGKPTFPRYPYDSTQAQDVGAARAAALRCAEAELQVDTLALGDFDDLGLLAEIAAITGGRARGNVGASDLFDSLPRLELSGVESVSVVNDTTGERVEAVLLPDGSFSAELSLAPDYNVLRVIVVPEGGEAWELECATALSYHCLEELDLCFRESTAALLRELLDGSEELAEELGDLSPCQALDLEDGDSPCAAGLRELTALVVNHQDGRLTSRCELDETVLGPGAPRTVEEAIDTCRMLVAGGVPEDCDRAAAIAGAINSGEALIDVEPPAPEPIECVATDPVTGGEILITIVSPVSGQERPLTQPCDASVVVEGAIEIEGLFNLFDLFFVIDSSGSTSAASGRDVDGDGILGTGPAYANTDPGDSVLEAELEAVRTFVGALSPAWARVAIIEFAAILDGSDGRMRIVQSLTDDFALVEAALQDISARGSSGATDYGGAVRLLNQEFLANAEPATRVPICFFLSDGIPTFPDPPYNETQPRDRETAIEATMESAALGIEINTYEVGPAGAADILTEMADLTGGEFYPSLVAGDIIDVLNEFDLAVVESVVVTNRTTGEVSEGTVDPDGSFRGSVSLVTGSNEIEVTVTVGGGEPIVASCETEVELLYANLLCNPRSAAAWASSCLVLAQPEARVATVTKDPATEGVAILVDTVPGALGHRAYRGDLDLLHLQYSHRSPFVAGAVGGECEIAPGSVTHFDPGALRDGRNWYYIIATLTADGPAGFGAADIDGDGRPDFARPGPDVSPTDLVIDECP